MYFQKYNNKINFLKLCCSIFFAFVNIQKLYLKKKKKIKANKYNLTKISTINIIFFIDKFSKVTQLKKYLKAVVLKNITSKGKKKEFTEV